MCLLLGRCCFVRSRNDRAGPAISGTRAFCSRSRPGRMDNGCLSAPLRTRAPRFEPATLVLDAGSRRRLQTQADAGRRVVATLSPCPSRHPAATYPRAGSRGIIGEEGSSAWQCSFRFVVCCSLRARVSVQTTPDTISRLDEFETEFAPGDVDNFAARVAERRYAECIM